MKKAARLLVFSLWGLCGCDGGTGVQSSEGHAAFPDTASHGYAVLLDACGTCHAPPHPEAHTAREWAWVVHRMEAHRIRRGLGAIAAADRDALLAYLRLHAGRPL